MTAVRDGREPSDDPPKIYDNFLTRRNIKRWREQMDYTREEAMQMSSARMLREMEMLNLRSKYSKKKVTPNTPGQ